MLDNGVIGALNRYAPRLLCSLGDACTYFFTSAELCLTSTHLTRLSGDDAARRIGGPSESSQCDGVAEAHSQKLANVRKEYSDSFPSLYPPRFPRLPAPSTSCGRIAELRQLVAGVGRHSWWRGYSTSTEDTRTERQRMNLEKLVLPSAPDELQIFNAVYYASCMLQWRTL